MIIVIIKRSMTSFSEHALGLTYGLLDSHNFKLQHDSVVDKVIVAEVASASAGASKVQLAVLFQSLLDHYRPKEIDQKNQFLQYMLSLMGA